MCPLLFNLITYNCTAHACPLLLFGTVFKALYIVNIVEDTVSAISVADFNNCKDTDMSSLMEKERAAMKCKLR